MAAKYLILELRRFASCTHSNLRNNSSVCKQCTKALMRTSPSVEENVHSLSRLSSAVSNVAIRGHSLPIRDLASIISDVADAAIEVKLLICNSSNPARGRYKNVQFST